MDARQQDSLRVSIDDFMTGLIIGLYEKGIREIQFGGSATGRFHYAAAEAFNNFFGDCRMLGLDVRFLIILDELYGDSSEVKEAIAKATMRSLLTIDSPGYQVMRPVPGFSYELARLPGGADLYRRSVEVFVKAYDEYRGP